MERERNATGATTGRAATWDVRTPISMSKPPVVASISAWNLRGFTTGHSRAGTMLQVPVFVRFVSPTRPCQRRERAQGPGAAVPVNLSHQCQSRSHAPLAQQIDFCLRSTSHSIERTVISKIETVPRSAFDYCLATVDRPRQMAPKAGFPNNEMKAYLYLDTEGIDGLYAQRDEMPERFIKKSREDMTKTSGSVSPRVRLANLLALLGLVKIDMDATVARSRDNKQVTETTYDVRPENKLRGVIEYLNRKGLIANDINSAMLAATDGNHIFCAGSEKFVIDGWVNDQRRPAFDAWRKKANKNGMLFFRMVDLPEVKMGMSLAKTVLGLQIGITSHFAVTARLQNGIFRFTVFGLANPNYVKPYSVAYYGPSLAPRM